MGLAGQGPCVPGHFQNHLLGDDLNRGSQVHFPGRDLGFARAGRSSEELRKLFVGHGESVEKPEKIRIQPEGAIFTNLD